MRPRHLVLALTVLAAACGSPAPQATTTSTTGTTVASPTTSIGPTSTTTHPSTSTSDRLEGNWADLPLVVYDDWGGMALGWWDGSEWVQVEADSLLPVSGGEDYQIALLGSEGVLQGGSPQKTGCDVLLPTGLPAIALSDGDILYSTIDDGQGGERRVSGVAISAPWEITPRPITRGEAHPDLELAAIDLLSGLGFSASSVTIVQTIDVDLDGDGAIETVVVAEETELANEISGVYSIVFAVSPAWDGPVLVEESVIPNDDSGFPGSFRVSAVADLSGDGIMEVVLDGIAWENSWVSVYEMTEGAFANRIQAGCGV